MFTNWDRYYETNGCPEDFFWSARANRSKPGQTRHSGMSEHPKPGVSWSKHVLYNVDNSWPPQSIFFVLPIKLNFFKAKEFERLNVYFDCTIKDLWNKMIWSFRIDLIEDKTLYLKWNNKMLWAQLTFFLSNVSLFEFFL